MKNKKLEQFQKKENEKLSEPTSVKLTETQSKFIRDNNLNLSDFIRHCLNELMKGK